jgi:hypothetical protein
LEKEGEKFFLIYNIFNSSRMRGTEFLLRITRCVIRIEESKGDQIP